MRVAVGDGMNNAATHCQICARPVKASSGLIAHHGYKRPGNGWQTASCFGARWRPYEVACDAIQPAIDHCRAYIVAQENAVTQWIAEPPATITTRRDSYSLPRELVRPEGFDSSTKPASYRPNTYELAYCNRLTAMRGALQHAKDDAEFLAARLQAWTAATT